MESARTRGQRDQGIQREVIIHTIMTSPRGSLADGGVGTGKRLKHVALGMALIAGCLVWVQGLLLRCAGSQDPLLELNAMEQQLDMEVMQQELDRMAGLLALVNASGQLSQIPPPPPLMVQQGRAAPGQASKGRVPCSGTSASGKYEGLDCEKAWEEVKKRGKNEGRADRWCKLAAGCTPGAAKEAEPIKAGCKGWEYKTKPGEAGTVSASKETATCISCLPLDLPEGLQCVPNPPPKVIGESLAYTNCKKIRDAL